MTSPRLRVLVALDPAAPRTDALDVVLALAQGAHAELVGLYVEDINLVRLAGLPCALEVTGATAGARSLHGGRVERALASRAGEVRRHFEAGARRLERHLNVSHSFRVTRGEVVQEVIREAGEADILVVARAARTAGGRTWFGATIYGVATAATRMVVFVQDAWATGRTVVVLYDGSPSAVRALADAAAISRAERLPLVMLLPARARLSAEQIEAELARQGGAGRARTILRWVEGGIDAVGLAAAAQAEAARVLVLPVSSYPGDEAMRRLLARTECSVVLSR